MQLQRRRTEAGLSCQALSAAAGLTPSHVALIENGQRNPRPATLKAIADVLGCSPLDLLDDAEVAS